MLVVEGLQAGYGEAQVLHDIHLSVGQGQVVTLLGRNGMGKTTTISTIFGLLAARGGRVSIDGRDVTRAAPHRIARAGLGLVPEGRQVFPTLDVRENLIATARPGHWTLPRVLELFPRLAERMGVSMRRGPSGADVI
jgi:branched-chain amino acid transport system ATP-binding protein